MQKDKKKAQSYLKKVSQNVLCNGEMSYISYGLIFFKESHKLVKDTLNMYNHMFSLIDHTITTTIRNQYRYDE